jgi:HlyD family secretion protein
MNQRINISLFIGIAFGFLLSMQAYAQVTPYPPIKPSLTISTATVQSSFWSMPLKASGAIAAWQEAVVSPRVLNLPLVEIRADLGKQVKRGEVLARFDDRSAVADLAQAQASLAQAKANESQAVTNRDRTLELKASGAVSDETILQSVTQAATNKAQVAVAQANVDSAKVRLENTLVVAPDGGVISSRNVSLGQSYGISTELFRVIRQNRLEWRAEVASEDLNKIAAGQEVRLELPNGKISAGKVRQIAPTLNSSTRLGTVYVDLEQSTQSSMLRPAMYANGVFQTGNSAAITVPTESVVVRDGRSVVFVIQGNRAQRVAVVTGRRQDRLIEIVKGLSANQVVAVKGAGFLSDGDSVQVANAIANQNGSEKAMK